MQNTEGLQESMEGTEIVFKKKKEKKEYLFQLNFPVFDVSMSFNSKAATAIL